MLLVILLAGGRTVYAQSESGNKMYSGFVNYRQTQGIIQASPAVYRFGALGYSNPAILSTVGNWKETSLFLQKSEEDILSGGGVANSGPFGIGTLYHTDGSHSFMDTRISFGLGDRSFGLGVSYSMITGDKEVFNLSDSWMFGMVYRPNEYISLGAGYRTAHQIKGDHLVKSEYTADLGIRPIVGYPLTIYGDVSYARPKKFQKAVYDPETGRFIGGERYHAGLGVSWEIVDGIRLNGKYTADMNNPELSSISAGFDFSLGKYGVGMKMDAPSEPAAGLMSGTFCYRLTPLSDRTVLRGGPGRKHVLLFKTKRRSFIDNLMPDIPFVSFGSSDRLSLTEILSKLERIKNTRGIETVSINMNDIVLPYAELWEVREKLKKLQEQGISIEIYAESLDIKAYHFASIADKIYLDPLGGIMLQGFAMGRSYYKDMLDKFGVGFEEIRLYKYKSAAEGFARSGASEADKEQRQAYIDDIYEFALSEISQSRNISDSTIKAFSNNHLYISAEKAMELNLIDDAKRLSDFLMMSEKRGVFSEYRVSNWRGTRIVPLDDEWSEKRAEEIAIVYAKGECAMESGIQARKLANLLNSVCGRRSVKAVILRVDSPGGSAMASDLVADVIKNHKGEKPIIVSQGSLAASGGYWLSMNADKIVAAPMTITGSIGVISSWIYNKGLADSLGIKYETVKTGKYSDFGQSVSLPLIGLGLPARNLTDDERSQMEAMIEESYQKFVKNVADGRDIDSSKVHRLGQGRIYSGIDAQENGLIDALGGIQKAIEIAKEEIGMSRDDEIDITEYSPSSGSGLPKFLSRFTIGSESDDVENLIKQKVLEDIEYRLANNGKPMYILPIECYDYLEVVE